MAVLLTPSTELEAVNIMLGVIGESPVSALDTSGYADVSLAQQILNEYNRAIQSQEWEINSEEDVTFAVSADGSIPVPLNLLKADVTDDYSRGYRPVIRGSMFYDKKSHSYAFDQDLHFDVVWLLPFEHLTEQLRRYITVAAARAFQRRMFSSDTLDKFSEEDEHNARAECLAADADVADYNMMDNYTVFRTLDR